MFGAPVRALDLRVDLTHEFTVELGVLHQRIERTPGLELRAASVAEMKIIVALARGWGAAEAGGLSRADVRS